MYRNIVNADLVQHPGVHHEALRLPLTCHNQGLFGFTIVLATGAGELPLRPGTGIYLTVQQGQAADVTGLRRAHNAGRCHCMPARRRKSRQACFFSRGSSNMAAVLAMRWYRRSSS